MGKSEELRRKLKLEKSNPIQEKKSTVWRLPDGTVHREFGPAIVFDDGGVTYLRNGVMHREDGPAIITAAGLELYYIDGAPLSEEQFKKRTTPLK
jgi:hypothetical protein